MVREWGRGQGKEEAVTPGSYDQEDPPWPSEEQVSNSVWQFYHSTKTCIIVGSVTMTIAVLFVLAELVNPLLGPSGFLTPLGMLAGATAAFFGAAACENKVWLILLDFSARFYAGPFDEKDRYRQHIPYLRAAAKYNRAGRLSFWAGLVLLAAFVAWALLGGAS